VMLTRTCVDGSFLNLTLSIGKIRKGLMLEILTGCWVGLSDGSAGRQEA
jgi:hypothetical protein